MTASRSFAPALVYRDGAFRPDLRIDVAADGTIERVGPADAPGTLPVERLPNEALLPGMVNAHSHAFQRGLRGKAETFGEGSGSFWSWRDAMYRLANDLDADGFARLSRLAFEEMLRSGITTVGEFHYLHHAGATDDYELDLALLEAARAVSIRLVALDVCYLTGDVGEPLLDEQRRFGSRSVDAFVESAERLGANLDSSQSLGLVAHSLRAVPAEAVAEIHEFARANHWVFHMHVEEQSREVDAVRRHYGKTPMGLLLDTLELGPELTAVHCTKTDPRELAAFLARRANVCLCPLTEANLADGLPPRSLAGASALSLGTDSNLRIDFTEEMRLLEHGARLFEERRGVFISESGSVAERLFRAATEGGARSLGLHAGRIEEGHVADFFTLDLDHSALADAKADELLTSFVFGAGKSAIRRVAVAGGWVVSPR